MGCTSSDLRENENEVEQKKKIEHQLKLSVPALSDLKSIQAAIKKSNLINLRKSTQDESNLFFCDYSVRSESSLHAEFQTGYHKLPKGCYKI